MNQHYKYNGFVWGSFLPGMSPSRRAYLPDCPRTNVYGRKDIDSAGGCNWKRRWGRLMLGKWRVSFVLCTQATGLRISWTTGDAGGCEGAFHWARELPNAAFNGWICGGIAFFSVLSKMVERTWPDLSWVSAGPDPLRWQHMEEMVPSWEQRHLCILCSSEGHSFYSQKKITALIKKAHWVRKVMEDLRNFHLCLRVMSHTLSYRTAVKNTNYRASQVCRYAVTADKHSHKELILL